MSRFHFSPRLNRASEIQWHEWGDDAFSKAKQQEKPVLLAISAVWCHWCHVMDETTYSSPEVIAIINERFIPVRVDNDQRPDVNARYNMGGWPTTAFLTPEGEILKGGTYIPPDAMRSLLAQIHEFYAEANNRLSIAKRIAEFKAERSARGRGSNGEAIDPKTPTQVARTAWAQFDDEYGGFGDAPKFPQTDVLNFLLDVCARKDDEPARTMVQKTLHGMAGGGMYDHIYGGFFRYSTTRDYSVPHFEKMLEDLSGLLLACARAGAMFGDAKLGVVAIDVKRYLDEHLWNEALGGYSGSQDADEEYYQLDAAGRAKLPEPYVDPTIYTSWNAQCARALLIAGPLRNVTGAQTGDWTTRGVAILQTLWSKSMRDGLMCRYYDGAAHVRGLLGDQVWCAWAALGAFAATADEIWLERAGTLIDATEVLFDSVSQAYLDRPLDLAQPGRLSEPSLPMDENALMGRVLAGYAAYTGVSQFAGRGRSILARYGQGYRQMGIFAAGYAAAVLDAIEPPVDAKIVGNPEDPQTRALHEVVLCAPRPPLRIDVIDPVGGRKRLDRLGYVSGEGTAVYLCREGACFARATTRHEVERALENSVESSKTAKAG